MQRYVRCNPSLPKHHTEMIDFSHIQIVAFPWHALPGKCVIQNMDIKSYEMMYIRTNVVIFASKKCITLNISELEFLYFPRQNDMIPGFCPAWNVISQFFVTFTWYQYYQEPC